MNTQLYHRHPEVRGDEVAEPSQVGYSRLALSFKSDLGYSRDQRATAQLGPFILRGSLANAREHLRMTDQKPERGIKPKR
jgi:hypothetical protein